MAATPIPKPVVAPPNRGVQLSRPTGPSVEDACDWLSTGRTLDEVAAELRRQRVAHRELGQVIELLRVHAMLALGETSDHPVTTSFEDEPF